MPFFKPPEDVEEPPDQRPPGLRSRGPNPMPAPLPLADGRMTEPHQEQIVPYEGPGGRGTGGRRTHSGRYAKERPTAGPEGGRWGNAGKGGRRGGRGGKGADAFVGEVDHADPVEEYAEEGQGAGAATDLVEDADAAASLVETPRNPPTTGSGGVAPAASAEAAPSLSQDLDDG